MQYIVEINRNAEDRNLWLYNMLRKSKQKIWSCENNGGNGRDIIKCDMHTNECIKKWEIIYIKRTLCVGNAHIINLMLTTLIHCLDKF